MSDTVIRPHHGMCMRFFEGRGYSEGFTAHMSGVIRMLSDDTPVMLSCGTDIICAECPNNVSGVCASEEKSAAYDRRVLGLCGLEEGAKLPYGEFKNAVELNIIRAGMRRAVCGGCEWDEICSRAEERIK